MKVKPLLTILSLSLLSACAVKKPTQSAYGSFTDARDGQIYKTIKIGGHTWMAQNLNYKVDGATGYASDQADVKIYGQLYSFYAAQAAVPKGWHLPTAAEWDQLKADCPDLVNKLNIRFGGEYSAGEHMYLGSKATFYTSTHDGMPVITVYINKGDPALYNNRQGIGWQLSVRCVKDEIGSTVTKNYNAGADKIVKEKRKPANQNYGTFTDERDGQVYQTVKVGNQIWMAQNLNYKTDGAQYYGGDEANAKIYGRLYGFYAAQAAVPKGWHLPTAAEWEQLGQACPDLVNTLKISFGGEYGAGKFRYLEGMATFYTSTHDGTPLITMHIDKGDNTLRTNRQGIAWQLSVRCVKDQPAE